MSKANIEDSREEEGVWGVAPPFCIAFGVAAATLLLQLTQTRIYGVLFWNHLVYFIISIALLGFGISGTWLAFGESAFLARKLTRRWAAVGFIASAIISSFVIPRLGISQAYLLHSPWQLARLCATYAASVAPYFFAGWILGTVYRDWARHIHVLYFGDLVGAAAGCLAYLGLIRMFGPVNLVLLCCLLAAGPVYAFGLSRALRWTALGVLALVLAGLHFSQGRLEAGIVPDPTKLYNLDYANLDPSDARVVEYTEWNPMCRTDVISTRLHPETKFVYIDGDAKTQIVPHPSQSPPPLDPAKDGMMWVASSFLVRPDRENVLVIGAGGGWDVWMCLRGGARRVDAVEINPTTVRVGAERYRKLNNDLYHRPGVTLFNEEGRSFVRRSAQRYDLITINAIDTFAATSAGAYMLSENYLYTVDAMKDYISHLTPRGILCVTRWDYAGEGARLFTVMLEALHQMGIENPGKHISVHSHNFWLATLVSPTAFTEPEMLRLKQQAQSRKASFYYPLPPEEQVLPFQRFCGRYAAARATADAAPPMDYEGYNVRPVYDDSPFFFHYEKARDSFKVFNDERNVDLVRGHGATFTLGVLLLLLIVAVIVFMFLPLIRRGRAPLPYFGAWLAYFACLGVAFIFVEIALMQRFALLLGHPSRSVALVLASLLFFAGVGSYLRERWRIPLGAALAALVAAIWMAAFLYPHVVVAVLGWPLGLRAAVTVLLVAPSAFFMGMPFPTGLRLVASSGREAVPWMWGVNGGATVLGSILAIIVALYTNFTTVLVLASLAYLAALLIHHWVAPSASSPPAS